MVHSDDVYLISLVKNSAVKSSFTRGERRSGSETMMGHTPPAALFQWPKMIICGIFCTYMGSIQERILLQRIWYIRMMFILISLVKNSAVKSSVTRGERRSGSETMMGHTLQQPPCNDQKWAFLAYFAPTQPFFFVPTQDFCFRAPLVPLPPIWCSEGFVVCLSCTYR